MDLTRRAVVAGLAVAALSPLLPTRAESGRYIRVFQQRFSRATAAEAATDWLEVCAYHSVWHYDGDYSGSIAFIRHTMTNLTYLLTIDDDGEPCARQVSIECCPANEAADPDHIVGHAARRVASHIFPLYRDAHDGCFFVAFSLEFDEPWRTPILAPAPPVPITPFSLPVPPPPATVART